MICLTMLTSTPVDNRHVSKHNTVTLTLDKELNLGSCRRTFGLRSLLTVRGRDCLIYGGRSNATVTGLKPKLLRMLLSLSLSVLFSLIWICIPQSTAAYVETSQLDACPGYNAVNIKTSGANLTADLQLSGKACNIFGADIQSLKLEVTYETSAYSIICQKHYTDIGFF